ncbi:MAG TPA: sodium:solute symporter [Candidatus Hydrogenedentes bacterium]|nr:sodium:solute symporter [Candidatus Hydrogenedentota bacterium]
MVEVRLLDIIVLVAYFGGISLAGLWFAHRNKSTEDYFLGGRNFPGWAIGLSMVGTSISSLTFMAYPADAYKTTWFRLLPCFTLPVAVVIASIWFLPFFRRGNLTSAYEYLEGRFGPGTRVYASCVAIFGLIFRVGGILFLLSLLVHELTGWDVRICIILGGLFVSFYTVAGGIEAVVWTDVVQTIVLLLGGLACLLFIINDLPGGLRQIFDVAIADGKFRFVDANVRADGALEFLDTDWGISLMRRTGTMMLLLGLTGWLTEYSSNQNVIQRYCAVKTPREARKAMWMCCCFSVPIWTYFMFLGTAFYVFFKAHPDPKAFALLTGADGAAAEQILPFFVLHYLPAGLSGLVVAAVLAAAMSSLDSSINAVATLSIVDIYRRHLVKNKPDEHYLRMARCIAIVTSAVMILVALWYSSLELKTFQDMGFILAALMGGGIFGLFMLGFLTTWGDGRAVCAGVVLTMVYTVWMVAKRIGWLPPGAFPDTDEYYTGFIANILLFLVGFAVGGLLPAKKRDLTNLTVWTQDDTPLV